MEKLIKQFIEKLDKDGVFSEDQIKEFESFGATIQKMLEAAEEKGKEDGKEEAEKDAEADEEKTEESIKAILKKVDEVKQAETKLALIKFKEHAELTVKETELVEGLSTYLTEAVENHLPEKLVVDYAKLDRLEKTFESIKETLVVTDSDVQDKVASVMEDVESELTEKSTLLNDALKRNIDYKAQLNVLEAEKVLEAKLKDVPEFEQIKLRKHFVEATAEEIEESFKTVSEKITQKEYDVESIVETKTTTVKEDLDEQVGLTDMERYAHYADRWIPAQK